jgi:phosphoserine phosphatase RsbU/P
MCVANYLGMEILEMSLGSGIEPDSARILVADDQTQILFALKMLFDSQGYQVCSAADPKAVLAALQTESFDLVLMDLNYERDTTGGSEGLDLVSQIRSRDQAIPLLVMTAWGNVEIAVEAMQRGACDFVQKPWKNSELLSKVHEQVERGRVLRKLQHRQEQETLEAKEIQKSLLPRIIPQISGYEVAANMKPVRFIGGDFYDIVQISETQTAFCIADVAGKGLPGALLMSNLQAALKPLITADASPEHVCERLNRIMCEIMPANRFVSLFYGVLDSGKNLFTYCNAGHNAPLLVRADGTSIELKSSGPILGRFPDPRYEQRNQNLSCGDVLLLFTDGVTEACDENEESFGEQKLLQLTTQANHCSASGLLQLLMAAVSAHCAAKLQDDATMIVVKVNETAGDT